MLDGQKDHAAPQRPHGARAGTFTARCKPCKGTGVRKMDPKWRAAWDRLIEKQQNPALRAELREDFAAASRCPECEGSGRRDHESGVQMTLCDDCKGLGCDTCHDTGEVSLGAVDEFFTTTPCPRCKATGEVMNEDLEDVCPLCKGQMYVIACTVHEKGSTKKGRVPKGVVAADDVIPEAASGSVLRPDGDSEPMLRGCIIDRVSASDPGKADVLQAYFGPNGDKWAPTLWGRTFALWPKTKAGRRLIEERIARAEGIEVSRASGVTLMAPLDLLAAERDEDSRSAERDPRRRALLEHADTEARLMLEPALQAFYAEAAR